MKSTNNTSKRALAISPTFFSWSSLLISLLALAVTLFPQLKFYDNDYEAKARAGNTKAQIFLADQALQSGNYEQGRYWYSIAADKTGPYQAKAINNLACINLIDRNSDIYYSNCYTEPAQQLYSAALLGSTDAAFNLYLLLNNYANSYFPDISYTELFLFCESMLDKTEYESCLPTKYSEWSYSGRELLYYVPDNTIDAMYVVAGMDFNTSDGGLVPYYLVDIYQRSSDDIDSLNSSYVFII